QTHAVDIHGSTSGCHLLGHRAGAYSSCYLSLIGYHWLRPLRCHPESSPPAHPTGRAPAGSSVAVPVPPASGGKRPPRGKRVSSPVSVAGSTVQLAVCGDSVGTPQSLPSVSASAALRQPL